MSTARLAEGPPRVGDHVAFRGTRIVGDVMHLIHRDNHVTFKVTDILGKKPGSKKARAWRGAWVTCPVEMVAPASTS